MLKQFTSKYRVLKTSWGIAIDIKGNITESESGENYFIVSDDRLFAEENELVILGLQSLTSYFMNKKYFVEIQEITFSLLDFQTEGLFWASRDWLAKAINLKITEPQVIFNKEQNRYIFIAAS